MATRQETAPLRRLSRTIASSVVKLFRLREILEEPDVVHAVDGNLTRHFS